MKTMPILLLVILNFLFISASAHAYVRAIFLPTGDRVILLMQAYEPGQPDDTDPRALYNKIAAPEQSLNGGTGKIVGSQDNALNITCATKSSNYLNVVCNFTIANSDRSSISLANQTAEFTATGEEAKYFYENMEGKGATAPFLFDNANGWIHIESTANRFYFKFTEKP